MKTHYFRPIIFPAFLAAVFTFGLAGIFLFSPQPPLPHEITTEPSQARPVVALAIDNFAAQTLPAFTRSLAGWSAIVPTRNPSLLTLTFPDHPLLADHEMKQKEYSPLHRRARKFQHYVERYSEKFQISRCLIYAIIKVESDFNVTAVSSASAHGLMQLVPTSGGRAAYKMVYGSDEIPTSEYLHDPDKNIELGTAYLRLLARDFFANVDDPVSRKYCQIAAYNTGAGNVFKVFGGGFSGAVAVINSLSPDEVYDYLVTHLPYEETRNYLPKVLSYQQEFITL